MFTRVDDAVINPNGVLIRASAPFPAAGFSKHVSTRVTQQSNLGRNKRNMSKEIPLHWYFHLVSFLAHSPTDCPHISVVILTVQQNCNHEEHRSEKQHDQHRYEKARNWVSSTPHVVHKWVQIPNNLLHLFTENISTCTRKDSLCSCGPII